MVFRRSICLLVGVWMGITSCSTIPSPSFHKYSFPKKAYVGEVSRNYKKLGLVKTKVNFPTLDPNHDEEQLCRNYYNKAVRDLVSRAEDVDADAVIQIHSVTLLENGKWEVHETPECSDDGQEGQILLEGIAIKWVSKEPKN